MIVHLQTSGSSGDGASDIESLSEVSIESPISEFRDDLLESGWREWRSNRTLESESTPQFSPLWMHRCLVTLHPDSLDAGQDDYYYGGIFREIQSILAPLGVRVELGVLPEDCLTNACALQNTAVVGLNPDALTAQTLTQLYRSGKPVVVVGSSWGKGSVPSIDSDNVLGAALGVHHLANLGHRHILFFGACPEDSNTMDRLRGYSAALRAKGLESKPENLILMDSDVGWEDPPDERLRQRLLADDAPTAVFAAGPNLAMHALSLARTIHVRVPEDISILCYDDPPFLIETEPPLSTVRQPLAAMAAKACEILLAPAESGAPPPEFALDPELRVRGSTVSSRESG
jgi:DNA-binding LacI/PurR family transcriptional regulator